MGISKKVVENIKQGYYHAFESGYYKRTIDKELRRQKEEKARKDKFILIPVENRLSAEFWSEQIVGLREEGFDYRYRCTERWWGYLDSMYRYEIERGLEGGVDIEWHIERMKKVYGKEVWSKDIEEILRRVYGSGEEVFDDMYKQRYHLNYYALSMFFNKDCFIWYKKKGMKDIEAERYTFKEFLDVAYENVNRKNKSTSKVTEEEGKLLKRYVVGIYEKKSCKEIRKIYKEFVEKAKKNLPSLYSHYKDYDPGFVYLYQLGVKQGYGECIKDVTDNDKIVYRKEFLEDPLF